MILQNIHNKINKPEYLFRPQQILTRLRYAFKRSKRDELTRVRLPWGTELSIFSHSTIEKALLTCGVHELAVSEVLWRMADPGEACCDIGANIGYMTSLLAKKNIWNDGKVL
jgi:hypothetical protein